jgi:hypothetical protein
MATIGLDKLYYAKITEDAGGIETYGTPIQLAKAMKADLSVELAEATLYADDGPAEIVKEFKSGKLSLGIDDITKEIRLEADQFNGNTITEVGFMAAYYTSYYHLVTHAFLQDSEGNQIAIQKTDTDVVIIRGTFYVTFNCTGFGDNGIYPPADQNGVVKWLLGTGSFPATFAFSRYNLQKSTDLSANKHGTKSTNMDACTRNATTWRIDYPIITWLDTERLNHTVRTIGINSIGAISLPNHTMFPPVQVTKISIGTGDGSTKDFKGHHGAFHRGE